MFIDQQTHDFFLSTKRLIVFFMLEKESFWNKNALSN